MKELTKTQIDRLGDRLRANHMAEADLQLLDQYRRSFVESYEAVVNVVRNALNLSPTGRPAKSTTSIIEKLRRESMRLTQMQDIAGCRLVVPQIIDQDVTVQHLCQCFDGAHIIDRRQSPSHGYRAVHVVVDTLGKPVEIQVRTPMQHLWAELSENLSDAVDPAIKYGQGNQLLVAALDRLSQAVADLEAGVIQAARSDAGISNPAVVRALNKAYDDAIAQLTANMHSLKATLAGRKQANDFSH